MRKRLVLALAMMAAISTGAFAQTDTHAVSTNLTEVRTLTVTGNPSIPLKRDPALAWVTDATSNIVINHDLLVPQKITVGIVTADPWTNRSLRVNGLTGGGAGYDWAGDGATVSQRSLVIDGAVQVDSDFVTGIVATGGVSNPLDLTYEATAGVNAVVGLNTADITYTLMDE